MEKGLASHWLLRATGDSLLVGDRERWCDGHLLRLAIGLEKRGGGADVVAARRECQELRLLYYRRFLPNDFSSTFQAKAGSWVANAAARTRRVKETISSCWGRKTNPPVECDERTPAFVASVYERRPPRNSETKEQRGRRRRRVHETLADCKILRCVCDCELRQPGRVANCHVLYEITRILGLKELSRRNIERDVVYHRWGQMSVVELSDVSFMTNVNEVGDPQPLAATKRLRRHYTAWHYVPRQSSLQAYGKNLTDPRWRAGICQVLQFARTPATLKADDNTQRSSSEELAEEGGGGGGRIENLKKANSYLPAASLPSNYRTGKPTQLRPFPLRIPSEKYCRMLAGGTSLNSLVRDGATVAEWLACSPPKEIRV
ncbi:hypothetical protein PR048_023230 [Dryococelus australis]|uniref:Uncharacterized protein n=1 Tax=Dryococelus australis TaxID=614101 RepID=A0ABQ9GTH8_9NEOP|nr:hypothetical protein PR048_023230 [Dryococelus australis]